MSCHYIGEGMNYVVVTCLDAYDKKQMSFEAARNIIRACQEATGFCDGNWYEAITCCGDNRCGGCLKKLPEGAPLYVVYNLSSAKEGKLLVRQKVYDYLSNHTAYNHLCTDCFMHFMTEALGSKELALKAKDILEAFPLDSWHTKKPTMPRK